MPDLDLDSFLHAHADEILHIRKPVALEHVGALTAQANQTIVFENLCGYPGFRLVDQLFVNRAAQSRVLGCKPAEVVQRLAQVVRTGAKPLRELRSAPCQERVFTGGDVDLAMLPIVRHTDLTRTHTRPVSPSTPIWRRASTTKCSRAAVCSAGMRWSPPS